MLDWLWGAQYTDEVWRWLIGLFALVVVLLAASVATLVAVARHDRAQEDTLRADLRTLWTEAEDGQSPEARERAWLAIFDAELQARSL